MYDAGEVIIYVGKARDLKKRLASYFRKQLDSRKTQALVSQIAKIEFTVTHTETEALILEHNLIKAYQPRYNVLLRDDKSYPYILVTDHIHPRIGIHRGPKKNKGEYFGPYPNSGAVRESLHLMQKLFPIRQCQDSFYRNRQRPCLQYQLKRCLGPCTNMMTEQEYAEQVRLAKLFLRGKNREVIGQLVEQMEQASEQLRFEQAARYRDQIQALRKVQEQQSVSADVDDLDAIGIAVDKGIASVHVLFIRQGKILGSRNYFPKLPLDTDENELLESFLLQFYLSGSSGRIIPREILLDREIDDQQALEHTLSQTTGYSVGLNSHSRADRARFVKLAGTNALSALTARLAQKSTIEQRFRLLEEALELQGQVARMECFDISHTFGEKTVASCVVFNREGPLKSDYRRYNIDGITAGDDYAAMERALRQRFGKLQEVDRIPDILFIDGGKGQLSQAEQVLADCNDCLQGKMPLLVGVAKGVTRKPGMETLIIGHTREELFLSADSPALHLIQHIRDESHRFAITGHRQRRDKARKQSTLEQIPGVGPKRRQALLKYLGGLQELKRAGVDELAKVPGISRQLAEKIFHALQH